MRRRCGLIVGLVLMLACMSSVCSCASGCSEQVILSTTAKRACSSVEDLFETVASAVWEVSGADPRARLQVESWISIPGAKVILGQVVSQGKEVELLMESLQEVLRRVGDLVRAMLGDWTIGLVFQKYDDSAIAYVPTVKSEDGTTLKAGQPILMDETGQDDARNAVELFGMMMVTAGPTGKMEIDRTRYIPGYGGILDLGIDAPSPPERLSECSEWTSVIEEALQRVGDILFDALEEGEQLIISTARYDWPRSPFFFTMSADTMDSPDQWEVYVYGSE